MCTLGGFWGSCGILHDPYTGICHTHPVHLAEGTERIAGTLTIGKYSVAKHGHRSRNTLPVAFGKDPLYCGCFKPASCRKFPAAGKKFPEILWLPPGKCCSHPCHLCGRAKHIRRVDWAKTDSADRGIKIETAEDRAVDAGACPYDAPATLARGNIPEAGSEGYLCLVGKFCDRICPKIESQKPVGGRKRGEERRGRKAETGADREPADGLNSNSYPQTVKRKRKGRGCTGYFPGRAFR